MASTKASNDRVAIQYIDEKGRKWRISGKSVYALDGTDGVKVGGVAADGTEIGALPTHFRPRRAQFVNLLNGESRYVICYTNTCAAWDTEGTTLTLDERGVDAVYTKGDRTRGESVNRTILVGH